MRIILIGFAIVLPAAALAAPAPPLSWGKPGVSLETYRAESIGCALHAYYTDVSDTKAAQTFVEGSRRIDGTLGTASNVGRSDADIIGNATTIAQIVHSVHPEEGIREIKDFQLDLVSKCLTDHGYRRFRLTDDQRKHLEKLKIGSDQRHAYLHELASDPDIVSKQAASDPAAPAQP